MSEKIRINKYIANAGICSRRDADKLVEEGRVTVNGNLATPGMGILNTDVVCVNGKVIQAKDDKVVLTSGIGAYKFCFIELTK